MVHDNAFDFTRTYNLHISKDMAKATQYKLKI